jgi:hypothetical protein
MLLLGGLDSLGWHAQRLPCVTVWPRALGLEVGAFQDRFKGNTIEVVEVNKRYANQTLCTLSSKTVEEYKCVCSSALYVMT